MFNEKHFDEGNSALSEDVQLNTLVHTEYYAYITLHLGKGNQQINIRRSCGDMYNFSIYCVVLVSGVTTLKYLRPLIK